MIVPSVLNWFYNMDTILVPTVRIKTHLLETIPLQSCRWLSVSVNWLNDYENFFTLESVNLECFNAIITARKSKIADAKIVKIHIQLQNLHKTSFIQNWMLTLCYSFLKIFMFQVLWILLVANLNYCQKRFVILILDASI